MRVGFTGTRNGMTPAQRQTFAELLRRLQPTEFHHGDCVGADNQAATIVWGWPCVAIIVHPPLDEAHRAFNPHISQMRQAKTHFARNRDIVNETDCLVATPLLMQEQSSGGTWYTINFAIKQKKPIWICWPDGSLTEPVNAQAS